MDRRLFLKKAISYSALISVSASGILSPRAVLASWPKDAFNASTSNDVITQLFKDEAATESKSITITSPKKVENGYEIPITISTTKSNVQSITILVENNTHPLVAKFDLAPQSIPSVSTQIKMKKSSLVTAIIKTDKQLYRASRRIRVVAKACI